MPGYCRKTENSDASLSFDLRLSGKCTGVCLIAMGIAIAILPVLVVCGVIPSDPRESTALPFIIGFGIAAVVLLPGLYLGTRWIRVRIRKDCIEAQQGWFVFNSGSVYRISDFDGLELETHIVNIVDARAGSGSQIGWSEILTQGVKGAASKKVKLHSLRLIHRNGRPSFALAHDTDRNVMVDLARELAQRFPLSTTGQGQDSLPPLEFMPKDAGGMAVGK